MDIDSDLGNGYREKTIEYVRAKYGENAVVGIITEGREGVKGALKDACAYFGAKRTGNYKAYLSLADKMSKKVPEAPGTEFDSMIGNETVYEFLLKEFPSKEDNEIIILAKDLEGMLKNFGQHAAGVVIFDTPDINDYIPTRMANGTTRITEMNMVQVEAQGMLKMDFLGLKTLNIISDTVRLIEEKTGEIVETSAFDPESEEATAVYENIIKKGLTKNVFQFESPGMRKYLKELFADA